MDELGPGEIGFFTAAIKEVADTRVGDTVTDEKRPDAPSRCRASSRRSRWSSAGFFPVDAAEFEDLREAMGKLRLNDASFSYEMETSAALGFGFRCGFLGLLHLEIIRSGSSANSISISSPPRPRSSTRQSDRRRDHRIAQPGRSCRTQCRSRHRRAVDRGDDPGARRISRLDPEAVRGSPRPPEGADLCRRARHGRLRAAAQRSRVRFLRSAEIGLPRLCQFRLSNDRL